MVRIAVGGLMHESNTFAGMATEVADFESGGLGAGPAIAERWGEAHHEVGGFFEGASTLGFEAVPTLMGWATPSGPLSASCYRELADHLIASIRGAGPVDAVLLALHGAMVADGEEDADGKLLARVRDLIGPRRPLVATLDSHANVSPLCATAADALVAYRTYPHVDQRSRGRQAAEIAFRAASGTIHPVQALAKPPLLIPILAQETGRAPLKPLMDEVAALGPVGKIIDASLLAGFPYADVAATGPSIVVVTDGDRDLADRIASGLSGRLWGLREALNASPPDAQAAVELGLAAAATPVILVDLGDNVGGGSAADSTVLVQELLRRHACRFVVTLFDPEAVLACDEAGAGGTVSLAVGGKIDRNAPPVQVEATVALLHDGRYVEDQPRHGGIRVNDQGRTAVLALPSGNTIVVNSLRHPPFSLGQLTSLGIDPRAARWIVVKAAVAYKAAYEPIAGTIIEVDTPGLTAFHLAPYTYRKIRRPIYPLDPGPFAEPAVP